MASRPYLIDECLCLNYGESQFSPKWSIAPGMVYSVSGLKSHSDILSAFSCRTPYSFCPPWMASMNFSSQDNWPVSRAAEICVSETIAHVRGMISPLRLRSYQIMLVVFNVGISRSEPEDLGVSDRLVSEKGKERNATIAISEHIISKHDSTTLRVQLCVVNWHSIAFDRIPRSNPHRVNFRFLSLCFRGPNPSADDARQVILPNPEQHSNSTAQRYYYHDASRC